jgi:hypothetical protein
LRPGRRRADEDGGHRAVLGEGRRSPTATRSSTRNATAATSTVLRSRPACPRRWPAASSAWSTSPWWSWPPHRDRGGGARPLDAAGRRRLDPGRFVPLAEDSGFIVPLGRWVLTQACRHAAGWAAADPAVRPLVSVTWRPGSCANRRTSTTSPPSSTRPGGLPSCCSSS